MYKTGIIYIRSYTLIMLAGFNTGLILGSVCWWSHSDSFNWFKPIIAATNQNACVPKGSIRSCKYKATYGWLLFTYCYTGNENFIFLENAKNN